MIDKSIKIASSVPYQFYLLLLLIGFGGNFSTQVLVKVL